MIRNLKLPEKIFITTYTEPEMWIALFLHVSYWLTYWTTLNSEEKQPQQLIGGWEFDESLVYYQLLSSAKLDIVDCAWYLLEYKLETRIITDESTTTKKVKP